ncbi:hypothetical protein Hanom_Chr10g00901691 [Helianthus anomalus]
MRALLSFHLIRDHCIKELVFRDYCVTIEKIFTLKNIYKNQTSLLSLTHLHTVNLSLLSPSLSPAATSHTTTTIPAICSSVFSGDITVSSGDITVALLLRLLRRSTPLSSPAICSSVFSGDIPKVCRFLELGFLWGGGFNGVCCWFGLLQVGVRVLVGVVTVETVVGEGEIERIGGGGWVVWVVLVEAKKLFPHT